MRILHSSLWFAIVVSAAVACRGTDAKPEPAKVSTASAAISAAAAAPSARSKLARIVFVDKQQCCQCTQSRIDASWSSLQGALAGRDGVLPVERLHVDTQAALVEKYRDQRPFMVIPAIYLLDGSGKVVELLQGELTQAQVSAALESP